MDPEKKMDFDGVFEYIGSMGIYQIFLFIILSLSAFTGSEVFYNNFIGYVPDHWCHIEELEELPHDVQKKVASPIKTDSLGNTVMDSCRYYKLNYSLYTDDDFFNWNRSANIGNDTATIHCQNGWVYDQSIVVSSIATKWDLVCNDEWKVQLVSTVYLAGSLAGALVAGHIADRFGRRIGIAFFVFLKVIPAFLSALSPFYSLMAFANFLLAVGSDGMYILCYTTLIEMVGPAYRPPVGMVFSIMYSLGFMTSVVFAFFVRDETKLQLTRAGLSCTLILAFCFTPESPRWLLTNREGEKAEKMIRKIAMVNGRDIPSELDLSCITVEEEQNSKSNMLDLFRRPIMRKRVIILCLHWFTDSLIYFALALNTAELSGDLYVNTLLNAAIDIPANILVIFLMNCKRIGRRGTAFFSLALAGVACLICVPLIITQAASEALTVLALLGKGGATMGWNGLMVYASELYPTDVRDTGIGLGLVAGGLSGMAAPFVGGPLADVWAPLPNVIFGSLSLVTAFLSLFLPETLGTPLPDNIQMAEEQDRGIPFGLLNSRHTACHSGNLGGHSGFRPTAMLSRQYRPNQTIHAFGTTNRETALDGTSPWLRREGVSMPKKETVVAMNGIQNKAFNDQLSVHL